MSSTTLLPFLLLLTASALAHEASAQTVSAPKEALRGFRRIEAPPRDGGMYHVATGTWTRPGASPTSMELVGGTLDTIYASTAPSGYFFELAPGAVVTASGRIPSSSSPDVLWNPAAIPDGSQPGSAAGCATAYQIDAFRIGYCTSESGPSVSLSIAFHESWDPICTSSLAAATPSGGPFLLTGLPGRGTATNSCWTIAIDLASTTASFAMQADGDGVFSLGSDDAFGWSFSFPSTTGTATTSGPMIAGTPSDASGPGTPCQPAHPLVGWLQFPPSTTSEAAGYDARRFDDPVGTLGACAPTYPANNSSFSFPPLTPAPAEFGSDMLGDDAFRVEGGAALPGCFFFGGPVSGAAPNGPYANFHLELFAKVVCGSSFDFSYCAGDGLASPPTTPCPCGNFGAAGNGCASSFNPLGAHIGLSGSVANNTLRLDGSGMQPSGVCIFLKGNAIDPNAFTFGDGISCTGGELIRLRAVALASGAASFPVPPETITLSARGNTPVGSGLLASYCVFYRNAAAAFCPPATFNVSNAQQIVW